MDETVMEREPPGVDEAEACEVADAPAGLPEQVTLQGELGAGPGSPPGRVYRAVLIRPGEWLGKGIRCAPAVLQASAGADGLRDVTEIVRVDQVDAVYRPAAGGEFVQVLNASGVEGCANFVRTSASTDVPDTSGLKLKVEGSARFAGRRLQVEDMTEGESMGEQAEMAIGLGTAAAVPGTAVGTRAAGGAAAVAGSGPGEAAAGAAGQPAAQAAAGGSVDAAALHPMAGRGLGRGAVEWARCAGPADGRGRAGGRGLAGVHDAPGCARGGGAVRVLFGGPR